MEGTISIDKLWTFIQSMSLSADNQRWLADRLIENSKKNESASQYTIEELNKRIDKAEASIAQGHVVSHHEVINQMNDFIKAHS